MKTSVELSKIVGKVALVTGGSRGIGKGIAKVLVNSGANVYITGRENRHNKQFSSVIETAEELNKSGKGSCTAIYCDHSKSEDIYRVFEQIKSDNKSLNILINNVSSGGDNLKAIMNHNFWNENPDEAWQNLMNVGLKSAYICSVEAAKIMTEQKGGMIINISSIGSIISDAFGPLYCMSKEATDRMTVNMNQILKHYNTPVISLWPGLVKTELAVELSTKPGYDLLKLALPLAEDPTLTGRAILHLFCDRESVKKSGKAHFVSDLAHEYSFVEKGENVISPRSIKYAATIMQFPCSKLAPDCKIPKALFGKYFYKF